VARVVPDWVLKARKGTDGKKAGFKHGFRSGLEVAIGEDIEKHGFPVVYEAYRLPYAVPASRHHYTWDFTLPNRIIIEGKGIFDSTDRAKHLFIKVQRPGLDIRFVFSNANAKIGPGSRTTLAQWCDKYGFKWAHKKIPEAWYHEPGPTQDPREVIKEEPYEYLRHFNVKSLTAGA
jgi:hypothetical protein